MITSAVNRIMKPASAINNVSLLEKDDRYSDGHRNHTTLQIPMCVTCIGVILYMELSPMCGSLQYAVPVTKYDRRGYKPRSRQLLLTCSSAVIVEETKLKQRIDYSTLKGEAADENNI